LLGSGAPRGHGRHAIDERQRLAEHLLATQPLLPGEADVSQAEARATRLVETMTMTERVFAESEMLGRARVMHSYDYDPLRFGS
jgi:hypothetical protein